MLSTSAPSTGSVPEVGSLELSEAALTYAVASRSPRTIAAYRSDFTHFSSWCEREGRLPLPATPTVVAEYITDLAASMKPATITRRVAAISVAHQTAGFDAPTRSTTVRAVLTGIKRTHGVAQRRVSALTISELRRVLVRIDRNTIAGKRDAAILLVGFALAARRSELVAMNVEDIGRSAQGITVTVRRSKTDQEGRGTTKVMTFGRDAETCPILALDEWLAASAIGEGPIFRAVNKAGQVGTSALSAQSVATVIKSRAGAAGLDGNTYSGHSLQAGHVSTAAAAGRPEREIANQTGHAPGSTVLRSYIRHASRVTESSAGHLGL